MRKIAMLLSFTAVLLLSAPALANHKGKSMHLTGCLSERDGSYVLTNKDHPDGVKLTTVEDLKGHLGHKVQVTGTWSMPASGGSATEHNEMKVTGFKHISKTCETSSAPASK